MKTSIYPFKVNKIFCSKYSVKFFNKEYIIYKSDLNGIKTCWVMEEKTLYGTGFEWFGCRRLSDYLKMLKLIYEFNLKTIKTIEANFALLKGGDKK